MKKENFKYCVRENDLEYAHEFKYSNFIHGEILEYEIEDIAAEAAEDFFNNHDGWEYNWPLDFYVYFEDKLLGVCEVSQDVQPIFCAGIKDAPQDNAEAKLAHQPTAQVSQ